MGRYNLVSLNRKDRLRIEGMVTRWKPDKLKVEICMPDKSMKAMELFKEDIVNLLQNKKVQVYLFESEES